MEISITHKPSKRVIRFDKPSQAGEWLKVYKSNKLSEDDLDIVSPIHLSLFTQNIPDWAAELFARVEIARGTEHNRIVPRIHWMNKKKPYSTGRTYYDWNGSVTHIAISAGTNVDDTKSVILHELAHAMCRAGEHHGRTFYRTLFGLWREFLPATIEMKCVMWEEQYKTRSRYWYAEYHGLTEVLAEYRPSRTAPKAKETHAQKTAKVLDNLFGD